MSSAILGLCIAIVMHTISLLISVAVLINKVDDCEAEVSRLVEHLDKMAKKENKDD